MALRIRPNENRDLVDPQNGTYFTVYELQKLMGGYISMFRLNPQLVMVVGENIKSLEENKSATLIVITYKCTREVIFGDAIICYNQEVSMIQKLLIAKMN